ncbi:MAG: hypothetical protein FJX72_04385 [Armatimonadetes bacterium]|nr:hypothetical protein [Armatimonadota bacterium]
MPVCERHKIETRLSCGRCDKPVCPDCAIFGPVGVRCRACASPRSSHLYQVTARHLTLAALIGASIGCLCGYLLARIDAGLLSAFWIAFLLGSIGGEILLRACERKRGPTMEITTGVSVALGYGAGAAIHAGIAAGSWSAMAVIGSDPLGTLLGAAVVVAVVVSRVRFL